MGAVGCKYSQLSDKIEKNTKQQHMSSKVVHPFAVGWKCESATVQGCNQFISLQI